MSDNLINCNSSPLTPEQLLLSLVAEYNNCIGLRCETVVMDSCSAGLTCSGPVDFFQLLLTCIGINATDGQAVLRVTGTQVQDCTQVFAIPCDTMPVTWEQAAKSLIVTDVDGNHALNLLLIGC